MPLMIPGFCRVVWRSGGVVEVTRCKKISGPFSLNINQESGLLIEGLTLRPVR